MYYIQKEMGISEGGKGVECDMFNIKQRGGGWSGKGYLL